MSGELPDLAERLDNAIDGAERSVEYFGHKLAAAESNLSGARDALAVLKRVKKGS